MVHAPKDALDAPGEQVMHPPALDARHHLLRRGEHHRRQSTRSREDGGRGEGSGVASALAANAARSSLILCVLVFFPDLGAVAKTSVASPGRRLVRRRTRGRRKRKRGSVRAFEGAEADWKSNRATWRRWRRLVEPEKLGGVAARPGGFVEGSARGERTGGGGGDGGA